VQETVIVANKPESSLIQTRLKSSLERQNMVHPF